MITRQVLRSFLPEKIQLQSTSVILRALANEMNKISNVLPPPFMKDKMTKICITYNKRSTTKIEKDNKREFIVISKNLTTEWATSIK